MVEIVRTMERKDLPQKTDDTEGNAMNREGKRVQKRPFGITLLGGIMLVGGIFCICAAFARIPAGILGLSLSGWPAVMIYLLQAGISIYIFHGFLRLKRYAWSLYIIFLAFAVINNLIAVISTGSFDPLAPIILMCVFAYYVYRKKQIFVN